MFVVAAILLIRFTSDCLSKIKAPSSLLSMENAATKSAYEIYKNKKGLFTKKLIYIRTKKPGKLGPCFRFKNSAATGSHAAGEEGGGGTYSLHPE